MHSLLYPRGPSIFWLSLPLPLYNPPASIIPVEGTLREEIVGGGGRGTHGKKGIRVEGLRVGVQGFQQPVWSKRDAPDFS